MQSVDTQLTDTYWWFRSLDIANFRPISLFLSNSTAYCIRSQPDCEEAADSTSAIFVADIKEEANFKLYLGITITEMFELRPSQEGLSWKLTITMFVQANQENQRRSRY